MCERLRSQCWLTGHRKRKEKGESKKRTTDSKHPQLMGTQGIVKEMCVGAGGVSELHQWLNRSNCYWVYIL